MHRSADRPNPVEEMHAQIDRHPAPGDQFRLPPRRARRDEIRTVRPEPDRSAVDHLHVADQSLPDGPSVRTHRGSKISRFPRRSSPCSSRKPLHTSAVRPLPRSPSASRPSRACRHAWHQWRWCDAYRVPVRMHTASTGPAFQHLAIVRVNRRFLTGMQIADVRVRRVQTGHQGLPPAPVWAPVLRRGFEIGGRPSPLSRTERRNPEAIPEPGILQDTEPAQVCVQDSPATNHANPDYRRHKDLQNRRLTSIRKKTKVRLATKGTKDTESTGAKRCESKRRWARSVASDPARRTDGIRDRNRPFELGIGKRRHSLRCRRSPRPAGGSWRRQSRRIRPDDPARNAAPPAPWFVCGSAGKAAAAGASVHRPSRVC